MITRVRLKNWKSHLDSDLKFSAGVNALIGIMGSGKTSVVEAISFALFGTFPGHKSRRLELENLIMKKPEAKGFCQVELEFDVDGRSYYVKRIIERGKGSGHAEIRKDGELLNVNARSVTDEVARALQMDYDLFSKAVYSEQNGLDYFLRIPRGKRKEEIDRMLKVDRFEAVRSGTVSLRNKVKIRREEKIRLLSDMEKEGLKDKADVLKKELGKLTGERDELETELAKARKYVNAVSEKVAQAEGLENEMNLAARLCEGVKSRLAEAEDNAQRMMKKFKGMDMKALEKQLKESNEEALELADKVGGIEKIIEEKRSELASVNGMIKLCMEGAEGLRKADAKCPICDSEITGRKKDELLEKRRNEEKELREKAKAIASEMGRMSAERNGLDEKGKAAKLESEKVKSMIIEFGELGEIKRRKEIYEKEKNEIEEKLKSLEKKFRESGLGKLRKEEQELLAKESELRAKIAGLHERISDKEKALTDLEGRLAAIDVYRLEAERDEKIMESMASFEKALKITQDQLREEFLKTVNSVMVDVWEELYPYGDFQGIRLAIEDDYVLQLSEPAGWVSVEGVSGGERSMAALALRIAFSMAFLPNLKWLILDEPTHNLDANAIRQFSTILREKMGLFAEQVFLITHEERISEGVTGRLYRMERDKAKNEPTRVVAG